MTIMRLTRRGAAAGILELPNAAATSIKALVVMSSKAGDKPDVTKTANAHRSRLSNTQVALQ